MKPHNPILEYYRALKRGLPPPPLPQRESDYGLYVYRDERGWIVTRRVLTTNESVNGRAEKAFSSHAEAIHQARKLSLMYGDKIVEAAPPVLWVEPRDVEGEL